MPSKRTHRLFVFVDKETVFEHFLAVSRVRNWTVPARIDKADFLRLTSSAARDLSFLIDVDAFNGAWRELHLHPVTMPMILIGRDFEPYTLRRFTAAGGHAAVSTRMAVDDFADALILAMNGVVVLPPGSLQSALGVDIRQSMSSGKTIRLSPREKDVLGQLADGKSNKLIAQNLGIAETTVKMHLGHLGRKLGVRTRTQILARSIQIGAVDCGIRQPCLDAAE